MKQNILLLYKKLGETPLDTITRYKQEINNVHDKLSFAGRLDPMAEGLLLVLRNEENKKRQDYEALSKTYECSFLTGFSTDSYDLLGKITKIAIRLPTNDILKRQLTSIMANLPGTFLQDYPPFSSYHIRGKPLYYWERLGKLDHTDLPKKEVTIYQAELLGYETIAKTILSEEIDKRLALITGDFRQNEIRELWKKKLAAEKHASYLLTKLRITCSSGTYIRDLVQTIGGKINQPTVTFSILRSAIGPFTLSDLS